jgi:hypothetical protein
MRAKIGHYSVDVVLDDSLDCAGEFEHKKMTLEGTVKIHPDQSGEYLINTILHEYLHALAHHRGLDIEDAPALWHSLVYGLAGDLTEMLVTSGLIKPAEWEARLRKNAKKI